MSKVTANLSEDNKYILVWFAYDEKLIEKAKKIPRAKFVTSNPSLGRHWRYKADLDTASMLRYIFGEDLVLEKELREWGKEHVQEAFKLESMSQNEDAVLENMPLTCPELSAFINGENVEDLTGRYRISPTPQGRPYQRADIKFLATVPNGMNGNQPGTGKTEESIGAIYEEQLEGGAKLVVCPRLAVNNVWVPRLAAWTGEIVLSTTGSSPDKLRVLREARELFEANEPFWLVINWSMVRTKKVGVDESKEPVYRHPYPDLLAVTWVKMIVDEWHKEGLANKSSVTGQGLAQFTTIKREALSGTPVRGNAMKLWGCLNWLEPTIFTSKWAFADQWLEVEEVDGRKDPETGKVVTWKKIHGVKKDREEAFYQMLSRHMVRRTKAEVLPWLPKKQYPDPIWVEMSPKQRKQYKEFALNAEVKIEDERLSATSILAEYARLKQFANAYCRIAGYDQKDRPIVVPTEESPKLEALMEILDTLGIGDKDDEGNISREEQVVVFSQFSRMVDMVEKFLQAKGIRTAKITGAVKDDVRDQAMNEFQAGGKIDVMLMTTTAGGVSIELDKADTVIFLDETWVPDDQEQAEDRLHRGNRSHQVVVYYIRTKGTIEEYIERTNISKADINHRILDLHRAGFRAIQ